MSSATIAYGSPFASMSRGKWIYKPKWDLAFISLSVILVPLPYLIWLFMSDVMRVESDLGRQGVNLMIAILIGGPHMYATFTRTALDKNFRHNHRGFLRSSIVIPLVVITLALTNLTLLLTVFFFWASIHVLHQIIYVVESYNEKAKTAEDKTSLTKASKVIDFAVVLTALYPIAAYRIAISQDFTIGPTQLNDAIPSFFEQPWVVIAAGLAFGISLMAFIVKSILEWRNGVAHLPKIIFISFTVGASFIVPALGNLDTAFQGMNVWHSFQYLGADLVCESTANGARRSLETTGARDHLGEWARKVVLWLQSGNDLWSRRYYRCSIFDSILARGWKMVRPQFCI